MDHFNFKLRNPFISKLLPISQCISINFKKDMCDFCLKRFEDISSIINCSRCDYGFYCSNACLEQDLPQHLIECQFNIADKIENCFSTLLKFHTDASVDQPYEFNFEKYYHLDDIIDITLLFFRMLRIYQFENEKISLDWINFPISFDESFSKKTCDPINNLSIYLSRFDELDEDEIKELDQLIGFDSTNEELFRSLYIENNVKFCLNNIIANIADYNSSYRSSQNSRYDSVDEINNDLFYDSCGKNNNYHYLSDELNTFLSFDATILDKNEPEAIQALKSNYRFLHLGNYMKKSRIENNEFDFYYNVWLNSIHKLLISDERLINSLKNPNFSDIEKVFFITIRHSITICDVITTTPFARAIYAPLLNFKHNCLSNTSLIFNGNQLEIYYLPEKKFDNAEDEINLAKDQITIDFNHEISTREDSSTVYIWNRLRFMNCECKRCLVARKNLNSDVDLWANCYGNANYENSDTCNENFTDQRDDKMIIDEEFYDIVADNRMMQKFEKIFSREITDDSIIPTNEHLDANIVQCFDESIRKLNQINDEYGNRLDFQHSIRIEEILMETIKTFREILGYYHPQITLILFKIIFHNLIIMKTYQDMCKIFYRSLYLHRYIDELIDSLSITHGNTNDWLKKTNLVHSINNEILIDIFKNNGNELKNLQQKFVKKSIKSWNLRVLKKCNEIQMTYDDLNFILKTIDESNENSADYQYYNPFNSQHYDDDVTVMEGMEDVIHNNNIDRKIREKLDKLFIIMKEILCFQNYNI